MRRAVRTILAALILAAACVVTLMVSEVAAQSSKAVVGNPIPGEAGYGVELGLDPSNGKILELLVYRGQKQWQALKVCTAEAVTREGTVGTIYYTDYNFDGHNDLVLEVAFQKSNASYCVWLFDPKSGRFVASPQLSGLSNPSPNSKTHHVISYIKLDCPICYRRESYRWSDEQLVPVREESVLPADLGLQTPMGCGWLRTVKEEKDGKMQFVSRNQVNDMGEPCLP